MKIFKDCPLLILLLSTGLLFTIIAVSGRENVYAGQDYAPLEAPVLSVMFTAINDGIYPWQVLESGSVPVSEPLFQEASGALLPEGEKGDLADGSLPAPAREAADEEGTAPAAGASPSPAPFAESEKKGQAAYSAGQDGEVSGNDILPGDGEMVPENMARVSEGAVKLLGEMVRLPGRAAQIPEGRLEPLRESTYEEYINHISADIYGDAGVVRAASYDYLQVEESYFDDALFIGDSRTVGLRDYTDLPEHADFYCETSLTIYKLLEEDFKGLGTIQEALAAKDYGKIYIMVGINELGRGTTENYMEEYTEVIHTLQAWEPDAKIIIQGVMRVSGEKNSSDAIFNNSNINARNNAVATLADNKQIFYIDVNEVVCDEEGNLSEEYTFDQIHLLGVYNDLWKQFLLSHGV